MIVNLRVNYFYYITYIMNEYNIKDINNTFSGVFDGVPSMIHHAEVINSSINNFKSYVV